MLLGPRDGLSRSNCETSEETSEECLLQRRLGEFWNELPHRLGQVDGLYLESTLEREFMFQDFLMLPETKRKKHSTSSLISEPEKRILRGEDIKDVPTTYVISGLGANEMPVIGTYVDKGIIPGFRYRIRLNQSQNYLFEGRALHLTSISLGYGKRITFESDSRNRNENFFWSDSRPEGYAFSLVVLQKGDRLRLPGGREVVVAAVLSQSQQEVTTQFEKGALLKIVSFELTLAERSAPVRGKAYLVKGKKDKQCRLDRVEFQENGQMLQLRPVGIENNQTRSY